ncbi:MAG: glycosyltransferase family 4 protein [Cyclobacteriaceae bacterium]
MRIAIVLNTSWNIYNFRMNFIRALQKEGHEIHTVAPADDYTHFLMEAGCIHHKVRMDSRGANPVKDSALIVELWSIYRKMKPDIILHYTVKPNVYGTIAASMLGIPTINNVCGLGTVFLKDDLISSIAMKLYRFSFRFATKVFFQNSEDLDLFLERKLVAREIVDLIPGSGVDLNKFKPAPYRRNTQFTFLLISRLISDKGIFEYIQAVKKLKAEGLKARFQILGAKDPEHKRGIKIETINEWIREGTIEYLGTTDDVRKFIHDSDCVVLPSYREGTPRTLLEAASSAKPIVATDVPGCHHVVEDGVNGLLCRMKDGHDLAEKMKSMVFMDDSSLERFGKKGREKVEREFGESLVINKYIQTLGQLQKAS